MTADRPHWGYDRVVRIEEELELDVAPLPPAKARRLRRGTAASPDPAYDDLPFGAPDTPPTLNGAVGRRCRRHEWFRQWSDKDGAVYECARCNVIRDPVKSARGKSSRRLGNDQERRAEKRYGFAKVGEFGGITDLQGRTTKVQMKATRSAPPVKWKGIFARLDEVADGRMPAILLSFVKQGLPADDYFIVRGRDFLDWRGRDDGS